MKQWAAAWIVAGLLGAPVLGAPKGPEILVIDSKVSINADSIQLGRLLQLLDRATGLKSKVAPDLSNRILSIRFSGLSFQDAVRKIFEGQPIDYVVVEGQGIFVTALSQAGPIPESTAPVANSTVPGEQSPFVQDNPSQFGILPTPPGIPGSPVPGAPGPANAFNQQQQQQQQQPATIQTPFGPVPNPRANQPGQALTQPGQPTPFGTPAPIGTNPYGTNTGSGAQMPGAQNSVFGNTSPPMFGQNPSTQQRQ